MQRTSKLRPIAASLLALAALCVATIASAGSPRCAHCGCNAPCEKVCRLVKHEKKVEVVCWGCKCEDFAISKPSTPGCEHCEEVCVPKAGAAGDDVVCSQSKSFVWREWIPGCGATILTKRKLMKRVETKKIPSFKWVVEDLCPRCEAAAEVAEFEPDQAIPLPPVVNGKLLYGQSAVTATQATPFQ